MTTKRPTKKAPAKKAGATQDGGTSWPWTPGLSVSMGGDVDETALRKRNHNHLVDLAGKIEDGVELGQLDRSYAAAAVRGMALRLLIESSTRPANAPGKVDPGHATIDIALRILEQERQGKKRNVEAAIRDYIQESEDGGLDTSTIRKAIRPYLDDTISSMRACMKPST